MATKVYGQKQNTTPVPILRQINRHNEDGSYSYGYEGADGQFKIETKYKNGDVKGKYGYVDDSGNLREVEYGADRNGFNPSGRFLCCLNLPLRELVISLKSILVLLEHNLKYTTCIC